MKILSIKKRVILSIITMIVFVAVLNKMWLIFTPMEVGMNINATGSANVKVVLNKKDNDNFWEIKETEKIIDFDKQSNIELQVKRSRYPKRIKLVISDIKNLKPITISDINFRNHKYILQDYGKFTVTGADFKIDNNKLIITPKTLADITIISSETLNVTPQINIDIKIFIIISVLSYLFAYKVFDYLAKYKIIEGKSRIEITFLLIFFILLFIPASHINHDKISKRENRTLEIWKPLITESGEINYNFGKDFNSWFNDRFAMRDRLMDLYDLKLLLSKYWITKNVIKGLNGWYFLGFEEARSNYINNRKFTDEELEKIDNYLKSISDYCVANNKKFYVFFAPDKSKVYGEFYNQSIKKVSNFSKTQQLIDYVSKHSQVKIIYPLDRLFVEKSNGDILYYKTDTHWTELGGYYGYTELFKVIKNDYNNLKMYEPKGYTKINKLGDLNILAPKILKVTDDGNYRIPIIEPRKYCNTQKESAPEVYCNNIDVKHNLNLIVYRDSFTENMLPYLYASFKKSSFLWRYNVKKSEIKDADIVILEMVERLIPKILDENINIIGD